ncbi:WD40 repeat domain-containing protein [Pirellulaceae bacterium]|nr:WD40 repeat domain-containing protein [Pirellulaceae bacterium]
MILRVTDGHVIRSWQAHKTPITCLEYHPDGKRIASATLFGIRFWDQTDAKLIWQFEHPPKSIHKIAFSEEGSVLAVAGDSVSVLNTETAELLCKVATESEILAVNQDGSRIATRAGTGDEGEAKIKFWEGKSGQEILSFDAPHSILWFSFGQGDRYLVGGRHDTRFIWDLSSAPDQPESPLGKRAK